MSNDTIANWAQRYSLSGDEHVFPDVDEDSNPPHQEDFVAHARQTLPGEETSLLGRRNNGGDGGDGDGDDGDDELIEYPESRRGRIVANKLRGWGKEALKRLPYYLPVVGWLPKYEWKKNFLSDVLAGLAVGLMLVPQCLAYSAIVGVPAIYGLYAGWMPVLVYSFFGTSRNLGAGPEGLLCLLIASGLYTFAGEHGIDTTPQAVAPYAAAMSFMVGVFLLLFGFLRIGFFDNLMSRPILAGFITASAFLLMVEQLGAIWGVKLHGERSYEKLHSWIEQFTDINVLTLSVGVTSIAAMLLIEYVKNAAAPRFPWVRLVPTTLIVVIMGIGLGAGLEIEQYGVAILGTVEGGFPVPAVPPVFEAKVFVGLIEPAILVAVIGFVEAMAVAKVYGTKHNYQVSSNRELVALGFGNFIGSFFLAFPTSASMPRSALADLAGCTSQMSGLAASTLVLATVLFLMQIFYYLPKCTIAAIIMVAASKLVEYHDIIFLYHIRAWKEIALALITLVVTFILGPEIGILIALGMSLFLLVKAASAPPVAILGHVPDDPNPETAYRDISYFPTAQLFDSAMVLRVEDCLTFANVNSLRDMISRAEKLGSHHAHPTDVSILRQPVKAIILDCKNIPSIDAQALQVFVEMHADYQRRGIELLLAQVRPALQKKLLDADRAAHHHPTSLQTAFFPSITSAMDSLSVSINRDDDGDTLQSA